MVWGVAAGLVGGLLGPTVAFVLHLPTRLLISWIALVAERGARWPLGQLRCGELVLLLGACACAVCRNRMARAAGAAIAAIALSVPALSPSIAVPVAIELGDTTLWRAGGSVLVVGPRARAGDVLAWLREARVGQLDLVVVTAGAGGAVLDAVGARIDIGRVVRPGDLTRPAAVRVGDLDVAIEPNRSGLVAIVTATTTGGARDPPV
jgi:hypothetical protein